MVVVVVEAADLRLVSAHWHFCCVDHLAPSRRAASAGVVVAAAAFIVVDISHAQGDGRRGVDDSRSALTYVRIHGELRVVDDARAAATFVAQSVVAEDDDGAPCGSHPNLPDALRARMQHPTCFRAIHNESRARAQLAHYDSAGARLPL